MANAKQARKKTISATSAEDARVMEALAQASKEAKRIADANKLPFIAGRKPSKLGSDTIYKILVGLSPNAESANGCAL